ncbi:hypothetical protein ACWCOT_44200 [Nonomuraea bangladeshensis]
MSVETFVEDAGLFYERLGLSRTAGRVMSWLLAAETGDPDAPELAEALAVAKSSMSVALALACGLRSVGHHPLPAAPRRFEPMTVARGVEFAPLNDEMLALQDTARGQGPRSGPCHQPQSNAVQLRSSRRLSAEISGSDLGLLRLLVIRDGPGTPTAPASRRS